MEWQEAEPCILLQKELGEYNSKHVAAIKNFSGSATKEILNLLAGICYVRLFIHFKRFAKTNCYLAER